MSFLSCPPNIKQQRKNRKRLNFAISKELLEGCVRKKLNFDERPSSSITDSTTTNSDSSSAAAADDDNNIFPFDSTKKIKYPSDSAAMDKKKCSSSNIVVDSSSVSKTAKVCDRCYQDEELALQRNIRTCLVEKKLSDFPKDIPNANPNVKQNRPVDRFPFVAALEAAAATLSKFLFMFGCEYFKVILLCAKVNTHPKKVKTYIKNLKPPRIIRRDFSIQSGGEKGNNPKPLFLNARKRMAKSFH